MQAMMNCIEILNLLKHVNQMYKNRAVVVSTLILQTKVMKTSTKTSNLKCLSCCQTIICVQSDVVTTFVVVLEQCHG